jgi:hypothetical protein
MSGYLDSFDVAGARTIPVVPDINLDCIPFRQRAESSAIDHGIVYEDVLFELVNDKKTETLLGVEPFDFSLHDAPS